MATEKTDVLESLGSRAVAALRAAFPDDDEPEAVAFRQAVESITAALVTGGVRGPVIDGAIRDAVDSYAGMAVMPGVPPHPPQALLDAELKADLQAEASAAKNLRVGSDQRPSIAEQIREVKNMISGESSLEIVCALQADLDDAAAELGVATKRVAVGVDAGREISGVFLASLGNPVGDANELVRALRKVMPDRDPEVAAVRSALESMTSKLYASGVGGAIIGSALGEALDVYVAIAPHDHVADGAIAPGYVLAFPGASDFEADELIASLRVGGNTVLRVDGDVAQAALKDALASAGMEPDELQP